MDGPPSVCPCIFGRARGTVPTFPSSHLPASVFHLTCRTDYGFLFHIFWCLPAPRRRGKTAVGIELAQRLNGEIISADARQVYRFMDIGTAKPTPEERVAACHHLIDFVDPAADYSAGQFAEDATAAIGDVLSRGKMPPRGRRRGVVYPRIVRRFFAHAADSRGDSHALAGRSARWASQIVQKTAGGRSGMGRKNSGDRYAAHHTRVGGL